MKTRLLLTLALTLALPSPAQPQTPESLAAFQTATQALQANRLDQAVSGFERVTQGSPRFAEAYLNLGLALSQQEKNAEAVKALEKAVALKPTLRGAHLFLAISLYKLNRLEPAAAAVHRETTLSASDPQAWMWQGIIDLALNRLALAVAALDHAATLDPRNTDILYHRGHAALALSRQSYEAMFQLDPHSWHVHQVLAEADSESGNDAGAVEQYTLAIAAAPPQSGLYEALGSSLWRTGKYPEAEQAYEKALQVDPTDILATYKLGCLRIDRSKPAEGKPLLERVLAADPSLKMTRYYLGRAEIQLGDNAAAVEDFKQVIHEDSDPETTKQSWFQLARAYRRLRDIPASDAAQAQYRLLDRQSKEAQQAKLDRTRLRADRDTSLPAPPAESPETP